jgi:hypothetical protein
MWLWCCIPCVDNHLAGISRWFTQTSANVSGFDTDKNCFCISPACQARECPIHLPGYCWCCGCWPSWGNQTAKVTTHQPRVVDALVVTGDVFRWMIDYASFDTLQQASSYSYYESPVANGTGWNDSCSWGRKFSPVCRQTRRTSMSLCVSCCKCIIPHPALLCLLWWSVLWWSVFLVQ